MLPNLFKLTRKCRPCGGFIPEGTNEEAANIMAETMTCAICLENVVNPEEVAHTCSRSPPVKAWAEIGDCHHVFHKGCLVKYAYDRGGTVPCPICREPANVEILRSIMKECTEQVAPAANDDLHSGGGLFSGPPLTSPQDWARMFPTTAPDEHELAYMQRGHDRRRQRANRPRRYVRNAQPSAPAPEPLPPNPFGNYTNPNANQPPAFPRPDEVDPHENRFQGFTPESMNRTEIELYELGYVQNNMGNWVPYSSVPSPLSNMPNPF